MRKALILLFVVLSIFVLQIKHAYSPSVGIGLQINSTDSGSSSSTSSSSSGGGGSSGGAGGGGGGEVLTPVEPGFTLNKNSLKVVLRQGEQKEDSFEIRNTGNTILDISTDLKSLKKFLFSPTQDTLKNTLNPAESESVDLVFGADEEMKPDVYSGEISVKSGELEKIINTIIEVESAKPLFDVDVQVLPEFKSLYPGDEITIQVSLFNVRGFGRVDVLIEYSIRDFKGNVIAAEEETVAVETQAKFVRQLLVPSDLKPGTYISAVKVTFGDSVGTSSDLFEVKAKTIKLYPTLLKNYKPYLFVGIAFAVLVAFFLIRYEFNPRKRYVPVTKEGAKKVIRSEAKMQKLGKELRAIEGAYKSGFISKQTYLKDKIRVEKELKKLGR